MHQLSTIRLPFNVADPLGIPRPIRPSNFFGITPHLLFNNLSPVPTGCLAAFDMGYYRPYVISASQALGQFDAGWGMPAVAEDPARYCFRHQTEPLPVPRKLWDLLPKVPKLTVDDVLGFFDIHWRDAGDIQLLDLLAMIKEDLPAAAFAACELKHPWIVDVMR